MKNINLALHSINAQEIAYQRWRSHSLIFISLFVVGLSSISAFQFLKLQELEATAHELRAQQQTLNCASTQCQLLKEKKQSLEKQLAKINRWKTHPKNPVDYIFAVTQSCIQAINLQNISLHKKIIEINAHADNAAKASLMLEQLKQSPLFEQLTLCQIKQNTNDLVTFTIKGTIKK